MSSTLWWRPVILDRQAAVPWQRLRPSWLLALQALAAILVIGALLRPALVSAQALAGQTVLVIDNSETMQATDVAPSRFAVAVSDARALVDRLGPAWPDDPDRHGPRPGRDRQQRWATPAPHPGARPAKADRWTADLQDALQLAVASAGPRTSGTRLIILSDGITEPLTEPVALPFPVQYKRIGASDENTAITALNIVPGVTAETAVAHVEDFGQEPARVTAEMFADGQLTDAQTAELSAGGSQDITFAVPPGTSYVKVTLLPRDDLVADDSAVAVASPPRKVRVLLVTNGDVFLQKALELRSDVTAHYRGPGRLAAGSSIEPGRGPFRLRRVRPTRFARSYAVPGGGAAT